MHYIDVLRICMYVCTRGTGIEEEKDQIFCTDVFFAEGIKSLINDSI